MGTIEDQLFAIVQREFGLEAGRITADTRLADLGDSLEWVNLLFSVLEEAFDTSIGNEQSESLHTVADLLCLVNGPAVA